MYKQKQILLRQKYKLWSQKGSQYSDPNHFLGTIPSQLQKETYELLIPYHLLQSQLPATPKRWQLAEGTWCSTIHSSNSKIFSFFFRRKKEKNESLKRSPTWKYFLSPIRSRASTMFLRSRLETIAQGMRAVDTASSHSLSPSMGCSSLKINK